MIWAKNNDKVLYYIMLGIEQLQKSKEGTRELGKLLANPNEYIQRDWINENTSLQVKKRDDESEDGNGSGYDLITVDGKMKIQSKLRYKTIHLEQTRRNSKKNKESAKTGHVPYSVGEADVYMFSRPPSLEKYVDVNSWSYIAIPASVLEDENNKGYLVTIVKKSVWKQYIGKAKETLESVYNSKK